MYKGYILPEHGRALANAVKDNSVLNEIFGQSWMKTNFIVRHNTKIEKIHPLYQYFISLSDKELFIDGVLRTVHDNRRNIISLLKRDHDKYNILSLVRNIQTYSIIKSGHSDTILEPKKNRNDKNPDIICNYHNSKVCIEVFCVNASQIEAEHRKAMNELHARVNRLKNNKYVVSFNALSDISVQDLNKIMALLKREIKVMDDKPKDQAIVYENHGQKLLEININYNNGNIGFVGTFGGPVRGRFDSLRIKNKILDKLENLQFYSKDDCNGYCIYLEDFMMEPRDVVDAIQGQTAIIFNDNPDTQYTRRNNGVLHDQMLGTKLSDWIDFIVVTNHPNNFTDYNTVQLLINGERNKITDNDIKTIFRK